MSGPVGFSVSRQQLTRFGDGHPTITLTVVAEGDVDPAGVADRVAASVERHEALRTTVSLPPGLAEPVQVISDSPTVTVEVGAAGVLTVSADAAVSDLVSLERLAEVALGRAVDVDDPVQYVEYAEWQSELAAEPPAAAVAFWDSLATTAATPAPLPGPPVDRRAGSADLAGVSERVAALASALHVTLDAAWLGIWCAAVSRLTGEEDVALGVDVDARADGELLGAAGPFVEQLLLPVGVPASSSVADVVHAASRLLAGARDHHEWVPAARAGAAAPFVLGHGPARGDVPRAHLALELRVDRAGSAVLLPGDTALAAAAAVAVTAVAAAAPTTPVGTVAVVGTTPGSDLAGATLADEPVAVIDRILAHARTAPEQVALRQGERSVTYAGLAAAVAAATDAGGLTAGGPTAGGPTAAGPTAAAPTAGGPTAAGAEPTTPVGVVADRSLGAVVALLAALAAGRPYVPLDPGQPTARLAAQLRDAGAELVLADAAADLGGFADLPEPFRIVRVDPTATPTPTVTAPPPAPPGDRLAYLVFTSGSTGTPKGVEVTTGALAHYVAAVESVLRVPGGATWGVLTPASTDLGNTALFGALAGGGTLVVLDDDEVRDPDRFAAAVTRYGIDAVKATPSHLQSLLDGTGTAVLPRAVVVLGGEALPWSLVDRIRGLSDCRIVNHYGPTEATVGSVVHPVGVDDDRSAAGVPIGRPLPGTVAVIRTALLAAVPTGAVGELLLGGPGLARGYRHDDVRTAAAFVDDPLEAGRRLYRTGDLARVDADGEIHFLGRRDSQVKIRGFRVELGEIEQALLAHAGVQRAAVVLRDARPGADVPARQLAAYVVSHVHPSPSPAELSLHLRDRLPAHMIPETFTELDTIPLIGNGKLDRAALPEPVAQGVTDAFEPPRSDTETQLAAIFGDLLGRADVGRTDDFFRLGGHSLLATQVVIRIRRAFDVDLPVHAIFGQPTVEQLAGEVDRLVIGSVDDPELTALLAQLEGLSDEEARALLDGESQDGPR